MNTDSKFPLFRWHLEVSSKCPLKCPRCPRTGKENQRKYVATELSLDFIRKVFKPKLVKNSRRLMFCGGNGDPIYNSQFLQIVEYFKQENSSIQLIIVTNGSYRPSKWWEKLSEVLNRHDAIVFSIDGWDQESNSIYRKNSDFQDILNAIKIMVRGQALVKWSTIVFKFNQNEIHRIKSLAQSIGVHVFGLCHSSKFGSPWVPPGENDPLEPDHNYTSSDIYNKNTVILNEFSYLKNDFDEIYHKRLDTVSQWEQYIIPKCQIGDRGLYIDATGVLYPCCWMGLPHDTPTKQGQENIWLQRRNDFDLNKHSLDEVLSSNVWDNLINSWKSPDLAYKTCERKCGQGQPMTYKNIFKS